MWVYRLDSEQSENDSTKTIAIDKSICISTGHMYICLEASLKGTPIRNNLFHLVPCF